jgi:hypothetical protein
LFARGQSGLSLNFHPRARVGQVPDLPRSPFARTMRGIFGYTCEQVPTVFHARKLSAILCLAALLFAVLTPGAHGLASAILVPFWLFMEILVILSIQRRTEDRDPYPFPFVSAFASRAPPIQ